MSQDPISTAYLRKLKRDKFLQGVVQHPFEMPYTVPESERDFNEHRGADFYLPDLTRSLIALFKGVYDLRVDREHRFPGVKVYVRDRIATHWGEAHIGDELLLSTGIWFPYKGSRFVQVLRTTNQDGRVILTGAATYVLKNVRSNSLVTDFEEIFTKRV